MKINFYRKQLKTKSLIVLNHISLLSDFGELFYHFELEVSATSYNWFESMMDGLRVNEAIWIFWLSKDNHYHLVINSRNLRFSDKVKVVRETQLKSHYLKRTGQIVLEIIDETFDGDLEHMNSHMTFNL